MGIDENMCEMNAISGVSGCPPRNYCRDMYTASHIKEAKECSGFSDLTARSNAYAVTMPQV